MSDTPRTDAALYDLGYRDESGQWISQVTAPTDFARQLERELAAANAEREELLKWKGEVIDRLIAKRIIKPEHNDSPKRAVHDLLYAAIAASKDVA